MFAKLLIPVLLTVSRVVAIPVDASVPSFNNVPSLEGFDDFNGVSNFDGSQNAQVVVQETQQTVCQSLPARIVQQRLVILQEVAKRIVSEQLCTVESQTVILEQFQSGIQHFSKTVVRQTEQQVGFDANIAGLLSSLINSDGTLNIQDLGFSGNDVGKNTIVPSGDNWNNQTSPASTGKVKADAKKAAQAASGKNKNNNNNGNNDKNSGGKNNNNNGNNDKNNGGKNNNNSTTTDQSSSTASSSSVKSTSAVTTSSSSAAATTTA